MAREVQRRSPSDNRIEFFAVSCSAYHWVCQENRITEYPTILAYLSDSTDGIPLTKFTPKDIAETVKVKLSKGTDKEKIKSEMKVAETKPVVDILGTSADVYRRLKKQTFSDAALSFTYALRHDIYKEPDEDTVLPLTSVEKEAFSEWIDLLFWTLPPTWRINTLLNDLRVDMERAVSDKSALIEMVNHQDQVVNEYVGLSYTWSSACSHGDSKAGYTCGLWNLLHVVTIGVAERHKAVLGARDRITIHHSASAIRDYIQYFLSNSCSYCRDSFLNVFDNCGLNSCKRFKAKKKYPLDDVHWRDLAIWLW